MSELLRIGDEAPLFRAAASDGETYNLGDVLAAKHVALNKLIDAQLARLS